MQEEDFDLMWYQINKIVSMVYPQWSQGVPSNTGKFKDIEDFRFPFTQVPTASPLIRLRVGDILKSNYSLENLKRLHGNNKKSEIIKTNVINFTKNAVFKLEKNKITSLDDLSELNYFLKMKRSRNYDYASDIAKSLQDDKIIGSSYNLSNDTFYDDRIKKEKRDFSIKNISTDDFISKATSRDLNISFLTKPTQTASLRENLRRSWYIFEYTSSSNSTFVGPPNIFYFFCDRDYVKEEKKFYDTVSSPQSSDELNFDNIFSSDVDGNVNNPYTKSFETAAGKGLAGFITSLSIDYQDQTWNVNSPGSNATHGVKITLGFAPVHDIPPGLDHDGLMRSPIYNVGSVNNAMFK